MPRTSVSTAPGDRFFFLRPGTNFQGIACMDRATFMLKRITITWRENSTHKREYKYKNQNNHFRRKQNSLVYEAGELLNSRSHTGSVNTNTSSALVLHQLVFNQTQLVFVIPAHLIMWWRDSSTALKLKEDKNGTRNSCAHEDVSIESMRFRRMWGSVWNRLMGWLVV